MSQTHELTFGGEICAYLGAHGWLVSQNDAGYDRELALFPEDVFAWLEATQPEQLAKKVKPSMGEGEQAKARTKLLRALADDLNAPDPQGGSLQVLRTGFKNTPATFTMMEKRPEKTSNAKVNARYAANRLRVMREVRYSTKNENRIDLVLFVNGIPVATVELKTDFNQSVEHAKRQKTPNEIALTILLVAMLTSKGASGVTGAGFITLSMIGEIPWWITVVILARELGITLMRFWVIRHGVMPASRGGKIKTFLQALAIGLFVIPLSSLPVEWLWRGLAWAILLAALVVTIATAVDYVMKAMTLRSTSDRARMKQERKAARGR